MKKAAFILGLALIGLALAIILNKALFAPREKRSPQPAPSLEISLWYWNQPFALSPEQQTELQTLGVKQLFVRAATFTLQDNDAKPIGLQEWRTPLAMPVHLVFPVDYSVVRRFETLDPDRLASQMLPVLESERKRAEQSKLRVTGVQLDFDCPTRLLPHYARLLQKLKQNLPQPCKLSITALPDWLGSSDFPPLLSSLDFYAPQFYEMEIPQSIDQFRAVSNLLRFQSALQAAERIGKPYYAGIPAYGHAFLFKPNGELDRTYRGMDFQQAFRHPAFELIDAYPLAESGNAATEDAYIGEDLYKFMAIRPARGGGGRGYTLVYDAPSPQMLAQHLALLKRSSLQSCLGAIIFRYPESGERLNLPMPSVAAVLKNEKLEPNLSVQIEPASAEGSPNPAFTLKIKNTGTAGTFLDRESVKLMLQFDPPGLENVEGGQFADVQALAGTTPQTASKVGMARANWLHLSATHLAAGETLTAGPFELSTSGEVRIKGAWSMLSAGGFRQVSGVVQEVTLKGKPQNNPHGKR